MAWEVLLITILAVSLIVASTCQFAAQGINFGRVAADHHRRRNADLRGLRQAAEISRLKSELKYTESHSVESGLTGSAVVWRVMEVAEVVDESADVRSYYLIDVYRQPLPVFRPGQHVLVRPALAGAYQTTRCYSLSSAPDTRYWRITVKQQTPTEDKSGSLHRRSPQGTTRAIGRQGGGLSTWLHHSVRAGDCLLVGGPSGHFQLSEENTRPLVLLAAGVGITPMASMLLWSQQATPGRPIRLHYQAQDLNHWPLGEDLHRISQTNSMTSVASYFSRLTEADIDPLIGRLPGDLRIGRFTARDVLHCSEQLGAGDSDYFLCGPNEWMASLRAELMLAGVDSERVHWESFGTAAQPQSPTNERLEVQEHSFPVSFVHSQIESMWSDPAQSLWELARQHQVDIPSGCLSGVCGCCRVKLLEGEVAYDRQVSIELAKDECLTCVARPKTACRLDV